VSLFDEAIEKAVARTTGVPFRITDSTAMGGGCINAACVVTGADGRRFFVKHNQLQQLPAFEEEARSLRQLAATGTVHVPGVVAVCQGGAEALLILECLEFSNARRGDWARLGQDLACLHRHTGNQFGWMADNFIGSTPQPNSWHEDWIAFYADCRLRPQIARARRDGLHLPGANNLLDNLPRFFEDYHPAPSLLHGDLWAGNAGFLKDGSPVLYDPASYFGDREADLAMTEMFGGFPNTFYQAYARESPLDEGYPVRKHLYNLYHLLNHFNLFGGGYGAQAQSTIVNLIAAVA